MVRAVSIFYLFLFLIGLFLISRRVDESAAFDPFGSGFERWPLYTMASLAIVAAVHALSLWAVRLWPSFARGMGELNAILGNLPPSRILAIALASGIAEEVFFRGWLLNETGLLVSSLIFGLVHIPPSRNWLYWPFFAFAMGLALGALCLWTNSLIYAIGVHAGINFINILRLSGTPDDLPHPMSDYD